MRTTLEIDDDVLAAAKELASAENKTAGRIISELARKGLIGAPAARSEPPVYRNGFRLLPRAGRIVTKEFIDKLLEEDI